MRAAAVVNMKPPADEPVASENWRDLEGVTPPRDKPAAGFTP